MIDPLLWDDWHVVADMETLRAGRPLRTMLLGQPLCISGEGEEVSAERTDGGALHVAVRYGLLWVCLGEPRLPILDIPEAAEAERLVVTGGALGVHVSAPRAIENFLDLGHLPYVHQGYLGAEPETEIVRYEVSALPEGGVLATGCKIFQPVASPAAQQGFVVEYSYKVERPLTTCLYKSNPVHPHRFDVIYLFAQPVDEEHVIAHTLIFFLPDGITPSDLRWFQQLIFLQDKPILENQVPRRLPIGEGMEMSVQADRTSVAYRRWLASLGLRYGTVGLPDGLAA
jgi:phenylpropionate dioxygenase-like ring-hydroxylating dioxygenase large terminal subunit